MVVVLRLMWILEVLAGSLLSLAAGWLAGSAVIIVASGEVDVGREGGGGRRRGGEVCVGEGRRRGGVGGRKEEGRCGGKEEGRCGGKEEGRGGGKEEGRCGEKEEREGISTHC